MLVLFLTFFFYGAYVAVGNIISSCVLCVEGIFVFGGELSES